MEDMDVKFCLSLQEIDELIIRSQHHLHESRVKQTSVQVMANLRFYFMLVLKSICIFTKV